MGEILDKTELKTRSINGTKYLYLPQHYFDIANLTEGGKLVLEKGKHGIKITGWSDEQPESAE